MTIPIKDSNKCEYSCISLGEVMLRLDPGQGRSHTTRQFSVWEGGGEYNVTRGLRRCFGLKTAVVTAFADNTVGRLAEDFILQGGVDTRFIQWLDYDGIGRSTRNGINFTERGFGIRGAVGCQDRGNTAASQLKPGDINWEEIFGKHGAQWFHTGGIYAALSASTPDVIIEAVRTAKKYGTIVSYDLNYRPSLWKEFGGIKRCQEVNHEIAKYVDVMIGNEEDFTACLGYEVEGVDENISHIPVEAFKRMIEKVTSDFPNFKVAATTLRAVKTANVNDWAAMIWHENKFHESIHFKNLEIFDRVGGGDSFASGLIYGFLKANDAQEAVDYGCIHGALAMTTPGDTSMTLLKEVERIKAGRGARVDR